MIARAGSPSWTGQREPHTFRYPWATTLTEATGGTTKAVADEGDGRALEP